MKLQMVGCSHHNAAVSVRERLAFGEEQLRDALEQFRVQFPFSEIAFLSNSTRAEIYTFAEDANARTDALVVDISRAGPVPCPLASATRTARSPLASGK